MPAPPDEGMQVLALGRLTVYPSRGEMQFVVRRLDAEGDGLWRKALGMARGPLEADGLLAPERKRALAALSRAASPSSRAPMAPRCTISLRSAGGAVASWSS